LQMMRQIVRDAVFATMSFKTSFDGLPDDVVLWADTNGDGRPDLVVKTDELWKEVVGIVSREDVEQAKQWYVTSMATRDRLRKEGFLLDAAAAKAAMASLAQQFQGTFSNIDLLATQTYFFPSPETYKTYYVLMKGFEKKMEPALRLQADGQPAKILLDHLPRANAIIGLGQVDAEVMLVSAFDIPHFKWKPDGWTWAKQQADAIKTELDAKRPDGNAQRANGNPLRGEGNALRGEGNALRGEGNALRGEGNALRAEGDVLRAWTKLMDEHSEYWDPPAPDGGQGADAGMKRRGRFGPRSRNDLQRFVGETPYSHWVTGRSITDHLFFDQAVGTIEGPFRGPLGYYLTRVKGRTPPTRPLTLSGQQQVEMLKDDYLRVAFVEYAKEAVSKATVKGF